MLDFAVPAERTRFGRLLDLDPDLAQDVSPEGQRLLSRVTVALEHLKPGTWTDYEGLAEAAPTGVLVVEGLLVRCLMVGSRHGAELSGAGDLIRPWEETDLIPASATVSWRVMQPTTLALLDSRIAQLGRLCPSLIEGLLVRSVRRARLLAYQQVASGYPQIEQRLLMTFAVLARRWGRVCPDGVHLPLNLTHELLGQLVTARRPSVTSGLGVLARQGFVRRTRDGWIVDMRLLEDDLPAPLPNG